MHYITITKNKIMTKFTDTTKKETSEKTVFTHIMGSIKGWNETKKNTRTLYRS